MPPPEGFDPKNIIRGRNNVIPLPYLSNLLACALSVQNRKVRMPLHRMRFDFSARNGLSRYKQSMKFKLRSGFLVDQVTQNNKKCFEISV